MACNIVATFVPAVSITSGGVFLLVPRPQMLLEFLTDRLACRCYEFDWLIVVAVVDVTVVVVVVVDAR